MLRMLAQRAHFVDGDGRIRRDWFTLISDLVLATNKRTTQASATTATVTGTTDSSELVSINVGPYSTGSIDLIIGTTCTNNANAKTLTLSINGTEVQDWIIDPSTDTQTQHIVLVWRSSSELYVMPVASINCTASGAQAVSVTAGSNLVVSVSAQLSISNDSVVLQAWTLDVNAL